LSQISQYYSELGPSPETKEQPQRGLPIKSDNLINTTR